MPSLSEIGLAAASSDVKLTPHAHLLIKVVLEGITEDPHQGWRIKGTDRDRPSMEELISHQQELLRTLPDILKDIRSYYTVRDGVVSTFDVLHWLTHRLDDICPFDK